MVPRLPLSPLLAVILTGVCAGAVRNARADPAMTAGSGDATAPVPAAAPLAASPSTFGAAPAAVPPVTPPTVPSVTPSPAAAALAASALAFVPLRLRATRVSAAPVIDGRLDDPGWTLAPSGPAFTQQSPFGGAPASERTNLRILYDDQALYIGFDCPQTGTPVVGRLTRRDEDSESEWVWVHLDSRRDARTAYFFAVNVAGVLADGVLHDGSNGGMEWDENWEARTARTATGWSAELRIPLRILRFTPDLPVQDWGIAAARYIALRQETDDWPYISREIAAPIPFFGRLDDLRSLQQGERFELRPFGLTQMRYRDADPTVVTHGFDLGFSAGLDLKVHLTPSLTFDAAVNPDFAQVESDQLILNLANYEIFYPEKRPLFLEGADQFVTPLGLFYSRRIGASPVTPTLRSGTLAVPGNERFVQIPEAATIYGAGKLIGRLGDGWTLGTLSAVAGRNDYEVVQPSGVQDLRTVEPLTLFNVFRLRRDVGERAQVGVIGTTTSRFEVDERQRTCPTGDVIYGTSRCFRDAYVGGLDAIWRSPGTDYVASGQVVAGTVRNGQPEQQADGTLIGPGDGGFGGWARLAKDGGSPLLAEVAYTGIGRRLTYNDLGFMPRQNLHELKGGLELRSLEPGPWTLERHLRLDLAERRTLDGLDLGSTAELGVTLRLRSFWILHAAADVAPRHFDDREVGDGTALERALYAGGKAEVTSDPRRRIAAYLKGEVRFLRGGFGADVLGTLSVRLRPQFEISLGPQLDWETGEPRFAWYSTMAPAGDYLFGRLEARSVGGTLRANYTFTPRLSLQAYAQLFLSAGHYTDFRTPPAVPGSRISLDDLARAPSGAATDADFEQAALNANVVLRWEYRLGSTLYLVYSRSQLPAVNLMGEPAALRAADVGRVPAVDVVLLKLSFWWAT